MADFKQQYGPWALVTGASSGIGAEFARQLAARGLNLVLVARRQERLEALGAELTTAHGVETRALPLDLTAPDLVTPVLAATADLELGLLINNAGFATTGDFLDQPGETQTRMVDLACRAPVALTHALVPAMKARGRGGVIFTASLMGFGGASWWATYNATKGFDVLLAEGLGAELAPHGVDVLALCPGGTRTEFTDVAGAPVNSRLAQAFLMDVEPVVRTGLASLGRRRVAIPGLMNWLSVFSFRFLPRRLATFILGRIVRLLAH